MNGLTARVGVCQRISLWGKGLLQRIVGDRELILLGSALLPEHWLVPPLQRYRRASEQLEYAFAFSYLLKAGRNQIVHISKWRHVMALVIMVTMLEKRTPLASGPGERHLRTTSLL